MGRSWPCARPCRKAPSAAGVYVPVGGGAIVELAADVGSARGNLWMRGGLNGAGVFRSSHILRRSERTEESPPVWS